MKKITDQLNSLKFPLLALAGVGAFFLIKSCAVQKPRTQVVNNFDSNKYLGKWYEIARFDFKYEKDMSQVTAEYSLNDDGSIKVLNKGFDDIKKEWKEREGKAKFNGPENQGALKVSFFGPFYAQYNVVLMDPDYENALVFGKDTDYIWILSRNKSIPKSTKDRFLAYAKEKGYDLNRLVWTKQD